MALLARRPHREAKKLRAVGNAAQGGQTPGIVAVPARAKKILGI